MSLRGQKYITIIFIHIEPFWIPNLPLHTWRPSSSKESMGVRSCSSGSIFGSLDFVEAGIIFLSLGAVDEGCDTISRGGVSILSGLDGGEFETRKIFGMLFPVCQPAVAQDVICFDSFLGQKIFDKVIVKVSLSVVVVIF